MPLSWKSHARSILTGAVLIPASMTVTSAESYISVVLPQGSLANDAVELGPDGKIYCTYCWFGNETRQILRTTPEGDAEVFATLEPDDCTLGMAFDGNGDLYSANLATGEVLRFAPDGTRSTFSTDPLLDQPADLEFHPSGNGDLYVANHGNGAIVFVHPDGSVETFYDGPLVTAPHCLTFGTDGELYVGNQDASVTRISPDGNATLYAQLPGVGYLDAANGRLFACVLSRHRIYEVFADGSIATLAGTGSAGFAEGPGDTTPLHSPNGIIVSADAHTIYASSGFGNGLFRVDLTDAASSPTPEEKTTGSRLLPVSPNPMSERVDIRLHTSTAEIAELSIYDAQGRRVRQLARRELSAGIHSISWDGADDAGGRLPAGVYQLHLRTDSGTDSRSIVLGR
ncbi:MAG: T9SS type A sorting domain-containing protein [Candidatus Eisenbacteria bacterium]|uniref:T9SS type A sorting domain-containing protein n=1 Tax=Eiseniibacteriota bacterium TaxID=2212470 RepID=A0A956NHS5_UNCEI|nr:T9SS type A sorting domain-containing protein [Candidatus Eisenbacteria bacterium]